MGRLRDQRGVALMLVLAALVVLTTVATEFAYNTNVSYHMALNERDRLKAQYLAISAYRFMLVELRYDKVFRSVVEKQNLGDFLGGAANLPLCQQFPMSTQLIRAVFMPGEGGGEEGEGVEGEAAPAGMLPEEFSGMISLEQREEASKFLEFEGDFEAECIDESTKINLNSFASFKPDKVTTTGAPNDYDQFKDFLIKFLKAPEYEDLFEKADVKPEDVARNIADWVDSNERINDPGGVAGAPEDTIYQRKELNYPMKNSKFTTPDEVYLVEGVLDDWMFPLENRFTIYGDEKVDVCSAPSDVVAAVIRRYVESKPEPPALDFSEPEMVDKLVSAVMDGCAMGGTGDKLTKNIEAALEAALGELLGPSYASGGTTGGTGGSGGTAGFGKFVSSGRRFYTLKLTGMVGDIAVRIKATVDVGDKDPKNWKVLYWRVF